FLTISGRSSYPRESQNLPRFRLRSGIGLAHAVAKSDQALHGALPDTRSASKHSVEMRQISALHLRSMTELKPEWLPNTSFSVRRWKRGCHMRQQKMGSSPRLSGIARWHHHNGAPMHTLLQPP